MRRSTKSESCAGESSTILVDRRQYRIMYILISIYTTLPVMFETPYYNFLDNLHDPHLTFYTNFLYFPWNLKPVFGFISDYLFPFKYRIKGYTAILTGVNAMLAGLSLVLADCVSDGNCSSFSLFVPLYFIFSIQAFIDSLARSFI